jgi:hypothetical protein
MALAFGLGQPGHAATEPGSRGVQVLPGKVTPPQPRHCPRPFAATDLALQPNGQPAQFDSALRSRLQARPPRVTIDIAQPFPLETEGPAPLAAWLKEARAKGGLVTVDQYCEAPRGLFTWLRKVFGGGAQSGYDAVDGYDAVLHADGANGVVTQVEFRLRSGA